MTEPGELPPTVPVDWFNDGLLWAVNAALLHPRGYALQVDPDTGEMALQGDGTERWSFAEDEDTAAAVDERFVQFHALLARAAAHNTERPPRRQRPASSPARPDPAGDSP